MMQFKISGLLVAFFATCMASFAAYGQSADRPIRIVVPYPAGATADSVARVLSQALREKWGRTIIVDNKPGASTIVGAEYVAHAAPDGETLLLTTESTLATNPSLYPKLPYTSKDFVPITQVVDLPMVLIAGAGVKANTVKDVIKEAQDKPDTATFASIGSGSSQHLSMVLFSKLAKVSMVHIPYRGGSPAIADVAGGHVEYFLSAIGTAVPFIKSGKVKAIGLTGMARSPLLPGTPTIAESGLPGYESSVWLGLLGPRGLPQDKIAKIQSDVAAVVKAPGTQAMWAKLGVTPMATSPAEFGAKIQSDANKWGALIRSAGIKPE